MVIPSKVTLFTGATISCRRTAGGNFVAKSRLTLHRFLPIGFEILERAESLVHRASEPLSEPIVQDLLADIFDKFCEAAFRKTVARFSKQANMIRQDHRAIGPTASLSSEVIWSKNSRGTIPGPKSSGQAERKCFQTVLRAAADHLLRSPDLISSEICSLVPAQRGIASLKEGMETLRRKRQ